MPACSLSRQHLYNLSLRMPMHSPWCPSHPSILPAFYQALAESHCLTVRPCMQAIWVLATVKGSAADKAGVLQGDEVVAIDGQAVQGQSAYEAATLIQSRSQPPDGSSGTASTRISLRVSRGIPPLLEPAVGHAGRHASIPVWEHGATKFIGQKACAIHGA